MDTSETYIKMCDCEEIQGRHWEYGDCFIQVYANGEQSDLQFMSRELDDLYYGDYPNFEGNKYAIWLPRQDQLQEMVGGFGAGFVDWGAWIRNVYPEQRNPFSKSWRFASMEQLWLAFVMKEEYNKVWNGEDWWQIL